MAAARSASQNERSASGLSLSYIDRTIPKVVLVPTCNCVIFSTYTFVNRSLSSERSSSAVATALARIESTDFIRVLMVAPSLEIVGGQSVQADRLRQLLSEEENLEIAFCPTNPHLPDAIRRIKYLRTLINLLAFFPLLIWKARSCDVLHIFTPAYTSYYLWSVPAMLVGRLMGKRVLLNHRDGRAADHLRESRLARWTLRLPHIVVVPSGYLVEVFRQHGITAKAIPNVVETASFPFRERLQLRPLFFTNRGLEPLYDVGCVIRAFAIVQQHHPAAELTIAHNGSCRRELEQLVADLGLSHVIFTGKVSQARMAELYNAADIYIMSPKVDNMPGTVLECFAAGIPVVSTNAGGIPYIVEDERTGLLVECGDPSALAAAALRLLETPILATRMAYSAKQECTRYQREAVRPQWRNLYSQLTRKALVAALPKQRAAHNGQ